MPFLCEIFPTRYRAEKWKKEHGNPCYVVVRVCAPEFSSGYGWTVMDHTAWVIWRRGG